MAPKKATKKKVSPKAAPKAKAKATQPAANKAEEPESEEKKKYRVACKAGLLTYNNPLSMTEEALVKHHKESKEKIKNPLKLSSCCEHESRDHWHTFFEGDVPIDCDLQYFSSSESGEVGDLKANNGKNIDQGHWYVQCIFKTSHICAISDLAPIIPRQNWLTDKWQQNKIERIKEALGAAKLLKPPIVAWIDSQNNHDEQKRIKEELDARQIRMQETLHPFAEVEIVEEWKRTFLVEQLRYKFLVLC